MAMNIRGITKRDEWLFTYNSSDIAEGAKKQKEFRLSRLAWWTNKKAELMAEIKDSGIEVTESIAAGISNYASAAKMGGPQVTIKPELQNKLQECHTKIMEHQQAADEYEGWIQVLTGNPNYSPQLTQADWLYFFGKN
jgi:hypothetical protein